MKKSEGMEGKRTEQGKRVMRGGEREHDEEKEPCKGIKDGELMRRAEVEGRE
jgi:hypothetical protein